MASHNIVHYYSFHYSKLFLLAQTYSLALISIAVLNEEVLVFSYYTICLYTVQDELFWEYFTQVEHFEVSLSLIRLQLHGAALVKFTHLASMAFDEFSAVISFWNVREVEHHGYLADDRQMFRKDLLIGFSGSLIINYWFSWHRNNYLFFIVCWCLLSYSVTLLNDWLYFRLFKFFYLG